MADDVVATLQKLVDGFAMDVGRVRAALAPEQIDKLPAPARSLLVGALNYVLDSWDIFPDHYKGVGLADDVIVLRLACAQAVECGASALGVQQLAGDLKPVNAILGDLVDPLGKLVAALPARNVKGRTAEQILADANVRTLWEADLNRLMKRHEAVTITVSAGNPTQLVDELRRMVASALKKAGLS